MMDLDEKVNILSRSAADDVTREEKLIPWETDEDGGFGLIADKGAFDIARLDTPSSRGPNGCGVEMKIGLTNRCVNDCKYCQSRASRNIERTILSPDAIASLASKLYRENRIRRFFLTSGIYKNRDYTMELICETIKLMRTKYDYRGYIHAKIMPGADPGLILKAAEYADRMSVNIELPSEDSLTRIAPQKNRKLIFEPMRFVADNLIHNKDRRGYNQGKPMLPAGQTTQMIIGASPESDFKILKLSESLYKRFGLKRVYYSAYRPVGDCDQLPDIKKPPLLRQHRLYQADWLIREYGFKPEELFCEDNPNLSDIIDPKVEWALSHPEFFPVEINKADYHQLIRIPGIGLTGARKILNARKYGSLTFEKLCKIGIRLKRSRFFITCGGRIYNGVDPDRVFSEGCLIRQRRKLFDDDEYEKLHIYPLLELLSDDRGGDEGVAAERGWTEGPGIKHKPASYS